MQEPAPEDPPSRRARGATGSAGFLAGVLGAAVALAFGELVDGVSDTIPSLVIAVGEVVIDYTPGDVVAFSIANIGDWQKTALTVGIVVTSLALCGQLGRRASFGGRTEAVAGYALLGIVGGWAAARNPLSPAAASWLVALAAALLGAAVTLFLARRAALWRGSADRADGFGADGQHESAGTRRSFFGFAAGAAVTALSLVGLGRSLRGPSAAEEARQTYTLPSRSPDPAAGVDPAVGLPKGIDIPEGIDITGEVAADAPDTQAAMSATPPGEPATTTTKPREQPASTTTNTTTTSQPPQEPAATTTSQPPQEPAATTTSQPPQEPAATTTSQPPQEPAATTTSQPPQEPAATTTSQPPQEPAATTTSEPPEQPAATTTAQPRGQSPRYPQVAHLDTLDDEVPDISRYVTPISPTSEFYRIDTALAVPQVDPETWRLRVTGLVDNPYELTYEDIRAMRLTDHVITLACVSNQVGGRLVGNAIWTGVPLYDLLQRAGVRSGAQQIVGRSVDDFTAGFPTASAYDGRSAILAIGMNNEPLPIRHGFPARIVVAGLYGYVSAVKWLEEIRLTTWDGFDGHWVPRGWSKQGPIKTQSRIDRPREGARVESGKTIPVAGIAWAPTRGIERVEVRIGDEGWTPCRLGQAAGDESWVQWTRDWTPSDRGLKQIQVRATDGSGSTQSSKIVRPRPNGAEGWHTIRVRVS